MAYPKKYEVIGSEVVYNTPPGKSFVLDGPVTWKHNPDVIWLHEDALVAGGMIRLVSEEKEKLHCEVCGDSGTAKEKKAQYDDHKALADHYMAEHAAHEAPREA